MNQKLFISIGILMLSLVGELFLWRYVGLFSLLLIVLTYIKHRIYPIKKELLWYLLICIGGAIAEIILINFGHGWRYSNPDIFGIPLWIPLFWGLVGTTMLVIYDALINN